MGEMSGCAILVLLVKKPDTNKKMTDLDNFNKMLSLLDFNSSFWKNFNFKWVSMKYNKPIVNKNQLIDLDLYYLDYPIAGMFGLHDSPANMFFKQLVDICHFYRNKKKVELKLDFDLLSYQRNKEWLNRYPLKKYTIIEQSLKKYLKKRLKNI